MCDYREARAQAQMLDGKVDLSVWSSQTNFLNAIAWMNRSDTVLERDWQQSKTQLHHAN
jgi:hypothetical protein